MVHPRPHCNLFFALFKRQYNFRQAKMKKVRAGPLVYWLREETHNKKVLSSNPCAGDWQNIFHINLLYNYIIWKVLK